VNPLVLVPERAVFKFDPNSESMLI